MTQHKQKQTALVTGGAGFLGTHLCQELLKRFFNVICLDNLVTGQMKHIQAMMVHPNFTFVQQDIIAPLPDLPALDYIFNLACPASPIHYQKDPIKTIEASVMGTYNMLKLATLHGATLFHASTSEIYGDPKEHPQKESYCGYVNPIGPRACYDEGKRLAETLCFEYERQYNTKVRVARIFNTYGPLMSLYDGRIISNFMTQALQHLPLTVYGDGSQTRSLCYVQDLIEGILSLTFHESFSGPVNLGFDEEITVYELAKMIIKLTSSSSSITFKPLPVDDPKQRKPDLSLALHKLNWRPTTLLKEGLQITAEYFERQLRSDLSSLV